MKIEIWSDVVCPFCYIGKRHFEKALVQFDKKENVHIEWKSFQLNPDLKTDPHKNINRYLTEIKGWSIQQAKEINNHVLQMAISVGLNYDFDRVVVANSFNAHRLIQMAKIQNKGDVVEEALFNAYFISGKNIDDKSTLIQIGEEAGMEVGEIAKILKSDSFADKVRQDLEEAAVLGIRGVPFFLKDRKLAISGAQPVETFLSFLEQTV